MRWYLFSSEAQVQILLVSDFRFGFFFLEYSRKGRGRKNWGGGVSPTDGF